MQQHKFNPTVPDEQFCKNYCVPKQQWKEATGESLESYWIPIISPNRADDQKKNWDVADDPKKLGWDVDVGPTRWSYGKSEGMDEDTEDFLNLWKKIHPKKNQIQLFGRLRWNQINNLDYSLKAVEDLPGMREKILKKHQNN